MILTPLIFMEVILPHKGSDMMAKVIGCKHNTDSNLVGQRHCIPHHGFYEVKFLDDECQHIACNIKAEQLLSGVDNKGNQFQIFKEIVDHQKSKYNSRNCRSI